MGFHMCEYCNNETSSGDVFLKFVDGGNWQVPDMILHYVADHDYRPDKEFVVDVVGGELEAAHRAQSKSVEPVRAVGYLSGPFEVWGTQVVDKALFFLRLWHVLRQAEKQGGRRQTRGAT